MTLADTVLVIAHGRIEQMGAPLDIYRNPANKFVATFIGSSNLIEVQVADAGRVRFGDHTIEVASIPAAAGGGRSIARQTNCGCSFSSTRKRPRS